MWLAAVAILAMFFSLKDCYKNVCDALRLILIITNLPRIWFADAVVLLAHSEGKIIKPSMCTTLCGDKKVICMQIKTESLCSNIFRYQSHALIHILNSFISHFICTSLQISAPFYSGAVCFIFAGWPNGRRVGWRQHYFYSLIPPLLNPLIPPQPQLLSFLFQYSN